MGNKPRTDSLGDRMKRYEATTRFLLPRRTYTILRVDGRAFHTWTRGLEKPYDLNFMYCMDSAAIALCEEIAGSRFAYVQSDEISVLAVDFLDIKTEPWFDGNVQKWASVGASVATMAFNAAVTAMPAAAEDVNVTKIAKKSPNATFDARVFTIPDLVEVENYMVWRQQDAERNSVSMLAQAHASHKQLHGKNRAAQHEVIHAAGDNWATHPVSFKHGRVVRRVRMAQFPEDEADIVKYVEVGNWFVDHETPVFTKDRAYIRGLVPVIWDNDLLVRKASSGE